jgi:hypothetical protein
MIVLGCYKILLFCDFEDIIHFEGRIMLKWKKKIVIETNFIIKFGKILIEIM